MLWKKIKQEEAYDCWNWGCYCKSSWRVKELLTEKVTCEHRPAEGGGQKNGPGWGDSQFRGPEAGTWQVCPSCNGETKMAGMKRAGGKMAASESTGWGRTLYLLLSGRRGTSGL